MTRRYLLDTNILSEPLKQTPDEAVLKKLKQHASSIHIAAPVWHELQFGAARLPKGQRRNIIEHYLSAVVAPTIPILPYDEAAASIHAVERARLSARGHTLPFVDGQIAAIAVANHMVLVTANLKDFVLFKGLSVINWKADSIRMTRPPAR